MKKGHRDRLDPPRGSHSHIPVMSPRQSSLPASMSSSHLGLVPPSRHLSVSGSPTHTSPTSSASSGGSTPFRSFRNLLQFGPNKTPGASSTGHAKSPFGGLGSLRRSMNTERSVSTPHLRRERSYEDSPVLAIDLPWGPLMGGMELGAGLDVKPAQPVFSRPSPTPSTESEAPVAEPPLAVSDLSTILESETSGISKHIPALDDSRDDGRSPFSSFGPASGSKISPSSGSSQLPNQLGSHNPSRDNSALDLSTSKVTSEVMEAMSEAGVKDGWLNGVVVDLATEDTGAERVANETFNLSALDPDLAALLSPNRIAGVEPAVLVAINGLPASSLPSPTRSDTVSARSQGESSRRPPTSARTSPTLTPSAFSRQSSPVRKAAVLPKTAASANLPSRALPRLIRSASDRPTHQRTAEALTPPEVSRAMSQSPERPPPLREPQERSLPRRPRTGDETERRPGLTRLTTPSRLTTVRNARQHTSTPPSTWDSDSFTPSSRPASSVGTAPSRLQQNRPSLDGDRYVPRLRARERSSSVDEQNQRASLDTYHPPPSRPTAEWLGPRTVKAFAAAGLLDFDKDGNNISTSRTPSRFGTSRSSIDRDTRSRQAPSRTAYSEAGSTSSWGRRSGSISHAVTVSDATSGPLSESASTPRTTFSVGSTAATSISASSSVNQHHAQLEIQQLQEKHSLETGVLLSALADSQRTTKILRDENTQLRDRLQNLEDRLADAHEQLRRMQHTPPSQSVLAPKSSYQRFTDSIHTHSSNGTVPSRLRTFLRPGRDTSFDSTPSPEPLNNSQSDKPTFTEPQYKRTSGASSVFHGPPSNMSMIMHEDGVPTDHSGGVSIRSISPSSPTLVLAKIGGGKGSRGSRHGHSQSIGSAGNISPTTANFSFVTGSPGSLNLRPEHELHLDDMPSLDLRGDMEDDDEYDDDAS
ncbi:hypothetical protein B0H21DRAFT_511054 [Amylocystis lapponica]|nr:hypothetical protein B0H21DRAFT_511054 [Amylocystis lapponica]